jgi:hypothetical protein
MTVKTGTAWAGAFVTLDATGALEAGTPSGVLYVDGVADAATVTITGSNPYKWSVTLPSLTAGQRVDMYITATISTIATAGFVASEQADTALVSEVKAETAVILADTNELQTDLVNGGRLDLLIDAIKAKTDTITTPPTAANVADAVWDEAIADHTTATTFGGKNQKVVPSETINDYKADVSGLALDGEYDADFTQVVELLYSIMGGEGWTDETLVSIQSAIEALDTNSVLLEAIDGTYTLKDVIYIMASLLGGKLTRVEDTLTFRDLSDTTNVVVAETDEHKQRIDMTYTV